MIVALDARLLPALCLLLLGVTAALADTPAGPLPEPASQSVDYHRDVQPLLARRCYACHAEKRQRGGLRLDRRLAAFQGGDSGPAIIIHQSQESLLVQLVAHREEGREMPPEGVPLTAAEIGLLRRWIDDGAAWPVDPAEEAASLPTDWWSLKPLVRPAVPGVNEADGAWVRTPVDAFVVAKLREQQLAPSPPAERRDLIRRITFDLHGLPPTPEEIAAFEADLADDAYERLVERLLASPRYGERWARHWLDVAHYGESNGFGMDRPRMNAWPYRDYVIAALNSDKPYARFVEEQLAADVLYADDPALTPALGFAAAGPFNQSALVEQVDGTQCKLMALNLDRDDMVASVAATFLSATVHCARCHDHKFDPISQRDYYQLQAVFAGVGRADRAYDADPAVHRRRTELTALYTALQATPASVPVAAAERAELDQAQAAWELSLRDQAAVWTPLTVEKIESTSGTTFERQDDHSYLATGAAPEKDTYRLVGSGGAAPITAVRLEVLADDRLPMKGPGRQDNGNLHLSEIRVGLRTRSEPEKTTWLPLQNASADFNQQDWGIARAIDGNTLTAWGIHPAVGKSHEAVFEIKQPMAAGDAQIVIELDQLHGARHLIGRVRVSLTEKAHPVSVPQLPLDLLAIVARAPAERNATEQQRLFEFHRLKFVSDQLAQLPPQQQVWAIAGKFPERRNYKPTSAPRPVHILRRGDVMQPLEAVGPGALECVTTLPATFSLPNANEEGARRAALARWITAPENMLTWRSIVNRVWHYHFGRGIVDSPNDFGRMGAAPSHPELLDWLAVEFRDGGGSLKQLHRLIVHSAVYRQSSALRAECEAVDNENRLLWRMARPRIDAEVLRDTLLAASGTLDSTQGGPAAMQFKYSDPNVDVAPLVDYSQFDPDDRNSFRRGIYRFLFRNVNDPLLEAFDVSDPSLSVAKRTATITSLQALSLWNNRFVLRQCEHLAARLERESPDVAGRIERAYWLLLGRPPSATEAASLTAYAERHSLAAACRVLANSNEFLFIR
jgi:mono/diheme cytochrome c family protein